METIKQLCNLASNIHDNFLEEREQWILWVPIFYSLGILLIVTLIIISLSFIAINIRSYLLYGPKLTEEIKYATVRGQIEVITALPAGERIVLKSTDIRKIHLNCHYLK